MNNNQKCSRPYLFNIFLVLGVAAVCAHVSVVGVREVEGGAVAVGGVEHGHLQVVRLVQRLVPAAVVGAGVCVGQQRLHLPRLAPPVQAGGSADARPAGAPALPRILCSQLQTGRNISD